MEIFKAFQSDSGKCYIYLKFQLSKYFILPPSPHFRDVANSIREKPQIASVNLWFLPFRQTNSEAELLLAFVRTYTASAVGTRVRHCQLVT
jgi:hypothetical protein